jgi:RimJ/RimL family protein N-acetyltransferase
VILTERLELVRLDRRFLEASIAGDRPTLEKLLDAEVPGDWLNETALARLRLTDLIADPLLAPWLLRAMVLRRDRVMVGHIGFHSSPDAPYLKAIAPGAVELGYATFPAYWRRGYARECCAALMRWAHYAHGVTKFVVSVGIDNQASRNLVTSLGFKRIASRLDEEDGPEDVFLLVRRFH